MAGHGIQQENDEILSEINVIPFVDICLVLLIIFMVTANFIITSSFKVDITRAAHAKTMQQPNAIAIGISRDGLVYFENQAVTIKELKNKLQAEYKINPDLSVVLSVDKNVNFKEVVHMLDYLSEAGITKLNIAATPGEENN
jgi:biopolymer transport protein ExbD